MDVAKVSPRSAVFELSAVLDSPEIGTLIAELEVTRWTGRPGFPIRAMALVNSLYAIPTSSRTTRLVAEHAGLQASLGCVPSVYACLPLQRKAPSAQGAAGRLPDGMTAALHAVMPEMGASIAIDCSDLPAYANGQRFLSVQERPRARALQRS